MVKISDSQSSCLLRKLLVACNGLEQSLALRSLLYYSSFNNRRRNNVTSLPQTIFITNYLCVKHGCATLTHQITASRFGHQLTKKVTKPSFPYERLVHTTTVNIGEAIDLHQLGKGFPIKILIVSGLHHNIKSEIKEGRFICDARPCVRLARLCVQLARPCV